MTKGFVLQLPSKFKPKMVYFQFLFIQVFNKTLKLPKQAWRNFSIFHQQRLLFLFSSILFHFKSNKLSMEIFWQVDVDVCFPSSGKKLFGYIIRFDNSWRKQHECTSSWIFRLIWIILKKMQAFILL